MSNRLMEVDIIIYDYFVTELLSNYLLYFIGKVLYNYLEI